LPPWWAFVLNREGLPVVKDGRYSVWFKTPVGEGAGVIEFGPNGALKGGDTSFAYAGNWEQDGERFKATLSAKRFAPGPPGVFGMDEIDITVTGHSDDGGVSTSCTGFAKQAPGLKLEVMLIRLND
jgi:T3SS negative regulator,GrlR